MTKALPLFMICALSWSQEWTVWIERPATDVHTSAISPLVLVAKMEPSDALVNIEWHISDGRVLIGNDATFLAGQPGVYTITLVATGPDGTVVTDDRKVYCNAPQYEPAAFSPRIVKIQAPRRILHPGESTTISAEVVDAEMNRPFVYHWFYRLGQTNHRFEGQTLTFSAQEDYPDGVEVVLIATDSQGIHSPHESLTLHVLEGNLPPEGRVVQPDLITDEGHFVILRAGESVAFLADALDAEGDAVSFSWSHGGQLFQGNPVSIAFPQAGYEVVNLITRDSHGNTDPGEVPVYVRVLEPGVQPDISAFIQLPFQSTRIFSGESLILSGTLTVEGRILFNGAWSILNLLTGEVEQQLFGNSPGRVFMQNPGFYQIEFNAPSLDGLLVTERANGNTRFLGVQNRTQNLPPTLEPAGDREHYIPNHSSYTFSFVGQDPEGDAITYHWIKDAIYQGPGGPDFTTEYNLDDRAMVGGFSYLYVECIAVDSAGNFSLSPPRQQAIVYTGPFPLKPRIVGYEQHQTVRIPVGGTFDPEGEVRNDGNLDVIVSWSIFNVDTFEQVLFSSELNPGPVAFNEAGLYSVSLNALSSDGVYRNPYSAFFWIHVFDPTARPRTQITQPASDRMTLEQNSALRLAGQVQEPNFLLRYNPFQLFDLVTQEITWSISGDQGYEQTIRSNDEVMVQLSELGRYTVTMETVNSLGLTDPHPDSITVEVVAPRPGASFEPNDIREQAAPLDLGAYQALSLSPSDAVDWYRLDLAQDRVTLDLTLDLTSAATDVRLQVYQGDTLVQSTVLEACHAHPFSFVAARAGTYFMEIALLDGNATKQGLDFGLGLSTLQPRLVFPYPKEDEVDTTWLSVVNPFEETAQLVFEARDRQGVVLGESNHNLPPHGRMEANVGTLFSGVPGVQIAWVRLSSDHAVVGSSLTLGRDQLTAVAEPAIIGSLDELIVPHIAQNTQQWFTHAALANNSADQPEAHFTASAGEFAVDGVDQPYAHTLFDFLEFFGGSLPSGTAWGVFDEMHDQPTLAGMEVFGKKDQNLQVAGLNLSSPKIRNPNFLYVRKNIIFPHVAKDTRNFWTGIAFVNTDRQETSMLLTAYSDGGTVLAQEPMTVEPLGKRVDLAHNLFATLDDTDPIAWIEVQTDGSVDGYELFGSNDGTERRLAGLSAVAARATTLVFPKIWVESDRYWTGLAVVNLSSDQDAVLTYDAFNDAGTLLAQATRQVGPRQKDVALAETVFSTWPQGVTWIRVNSTQPMAAFELVGDIAGDFLGGIIAQ